MALQILTITPEVGAAFPVLYNPERYSMSKGVQYAEIGIPGLDSPLLQYVRGQNEKVTLELFFDTTDYGLTDNVKDVREFTKKVYALTKVNGATHAPLRFVLSWGDCPTITSYDWKTPAWMVMESVSQEFQLFSPSGIPLRAKLNTTMREAWKIEQQLKETPRESSDRTKVRRVQRGQSIVHLANSEYNDPHEWRAIADANELDNPRFLEPGATLVVPRNTSEGR